MSSPVRLTDAVQQAIVAYVRAGGFAEVAAEAAGVRRRTFLNWMRKGDDPKGKPRYRAFALAVRQAQAQARLGAEVSARNDKPLDWLRNGPGRETADQRGWTSNARPAASKASGAALLQAEVRDLVDRVLSALAAHPEVRAALAEELAGGETAKKVGLHSTAASGYDPQEHERLSSPTPVRDPAADRLRQE